MASGEPWLNLSPNATTKNVNGPQGLQKSRCGRRPFKTRQPFSRKKKLSWPARKVGTAPTNAQQAQIETSTTKKEIASHWLGRPFVHQASKILLNSLVTVRSPWMFESLRILCPAAGKPGRSSASGFRTEWRFGANCRRSEVERVYIQFPTLVVIYK